MALTNKQILQQARKRYDDTYKIWQPMRQKNSELLTFISGEQWTYQARQTFENAGFTAFTSNRIPTFLRQITNELMKNTPQGKVDPRNDEDVELAEGMNDHIRNIQEECKANVAYVKAANDAASVGIGYWRVITKYKDEHDFDQELAIEPIWDVNTVMLDPHHRGLAAEDAEFGFVSVTMSKDEYAQRWGDTLVGRVINGNWTEADLKDVSWKMAEQKWQQSENDVTISEYYFKDYKKKNLYQLKNKRTKEIIKSTNSKEAKKAKYEILDQREVNVPVIRWVKMNDIEILEQTEFPGTFIPIVPVKADEYWVEGKRTLVGAVEPAVEAQVQLNYAKSWLGQLLQSAPKAPIQGTVGQFKNLEAYYQNANVSNITILPYNKDMEGGVLAPPPFRDHGGTSIELAASLVTAAEQDLLKIFGTFDPDNTKGVVESGKARLIRENQSFNSNYHFYENLAHSIQHTIRIILEATPVVYDTARTVQLMSQDGKKRSIAINTPNEAGVMEYDFTKTNNYSVSIQTGPSFGTKRQEFAAAGMDLITSYPAAAPAVADLIVRAMDWPGADKIADSLEAIADPRALAARKMNKKDAAAMVPGLQGQLAAAQAQIQELKVNEQKHVAEMNKAASDIKVEMMKADTEMKKAQLDNEFKMKQLKFDEELAELELLIKEKELEIKMAELKLKKIDQNHKMIGDAHDRTVAHIDKMTGADEETEEESNTGIQDDLK